MKHEYEAKFLSVDVAGLLGRDILAEPTLLFAGAGNAR